MTRNKLKGICLHSKFESRNVKDTLDNKSWVEEMMRKQNREKKKTSIDPRIKIQLAQSGYLEIR